MSSLHVTVSDPVLQSEDPFVVRLLFEPSGRPDSQQDYYLTAKENLCVVCGKADSYIRFDTWYVLIHSFSEVGLLEKSLFSNDIKATELTNDFRLVLFS